MDFRNQPRSAACLLAASLLLTMGCATRRYDAHGRPYYEPYDHSHATEGAVLGGLAGAGIGQAVAGYRDAPAGFWLGGALGAITGAVIGDAVDRQKQRVDEPPCPPYPDGPPPPPRVYPPPYRRDGYDPGPPDRRFDSPPDRGWDRPDPDGPYGYEPPPPSEPEPLFLNLPAEVIFATGSDQLEPGAQSRLRSVAKAMRNHPATRAVIRGHASAAEPHDGPLSEARSRAVRDYLVRQGIAPSRVVAVGMGARFPVASERTAEGRQRNRRVEIEIQSERGHDLARLW